MNICVLLKWIVDPTSIQWDYEQQHYAFITHGFNQIDLCALQWASDYKDQHSGHITVLLAIDAKMEFNQQVLMKYKIDDCVVIKVENLQGYRNEVASLLAKESKHRAFDLILSGSQSEDTHLGITPVMYAEMLNLPFLSNIHHIEPSSDKVWKVQRKEGRGLVQTFQIELPAVIGVVRSIARKRYVAKYSALLPSKKASIIRVDGQIDKAPDVIVVKVTEPKPNIRYSSVPSSKLSAEKRLQEIMGFTQESKVDNKAKIAKGISDNNIHFIKDKIEKWLKEE